jgi:hypothetical protein
MHSASALPSALGIAMGPSARMNVPENLHRERSTSAMRLSPSGDRR